MVFNTVRCQRCPAWVIHTTGGSGQPLIVNSRPEPRGVLELYWRDDELHSRLVPPDGRELVRKSSGGLYRRHAPSCRPLVRVSAR